MFSPQQKESFDLENSNNVIATPSPDQPGDQITQVTRSLQVEYFSSDKCS